MVIDPNDATGTPANNLATNDYQFPIVPRTAYGTGATTATSPWFGSNPSVLMASQNGLDLADPNQTNNYIVVPPGTTSAAADGSVPVTNPPTATVASGTQLLQFTDSAGVNILPNANPVVLRIELRRRADPNRAPILPTDTAQATEAADNPWITVDFMDVPVSVLALKLTGNPADFSTQIRGQLGGYYPNVPSSVNTAYSMGGYYPYSLAAPLVSTERSQPLYHDYGLNPFNPATTNPTSPNGPFVVTSAIPYLRNGGVTTLAPPLWQGNSLAQDNDAAGFNPGTVTPPAKAIAPHSLYQPHYDRDFTSVGELFNIPLYGQGQAPQWSANTAYTVGATVVPPSGVNTAGTGGLTFVCTVAGTSSATPPAAWPVTPLATQTDGSVTWTAAGIGFNGASTSAYQPPLLSGLTHLMGSRVLENGTALTTGTSYTPEVLVGTDFVPTDTTTIPPPVKLHYSGYGTAGFRFQHPEGADQTEPNPAIDFTENRWHRMLGLLEVPTRSHRGIDEPSGIAPYQVAAGSINGPLGFYRTPGKINLNTLRYPDIVAGLVGEPDIFNMTFTLPLASGLDLPTGLSIPYLLPSLDTTSANTIPSPPGPSGSGDIVAIAPPQNPLGAVNQPRDWWEQFIAARDGVDPLPVGNGGTGLSIPGLPRTVSGTTPFTGLAVTPGSHPFHALNFSAYGGVDANGYNGTLESTLLRALGGDTVTTPVPQTPSNSGAGFDLRRRLLEVGNATDHYKSGVDYATKQRLLARLAGNATTRSNVFLVWIQVDFFQAKDVGPSLSTPDSGVVRIGAKLNTSPAYRGFFVIDRSQALPMVTPQYLPTTTGTQPFVFSFNQAFNWQSLVLYRQRIQ